VKSGGHTFVFDAFTSEVNKHPDFHTRGFQLVQKLRLVWSVIALGHFDLDDYAAVNEEICIILATTALLCRTLIVSVSALLPHLISPTCIAR
jgi:hypothetical protein